VNVTFAQDRLESDLGFSGAVYGRGDRPGQLDREPRRVRGALPRRADEDATGSTDGGLLTLAAILAVGSVLATRVAHDPAVERARRPSDRFSREPCVAAPKRVRSVV
jgi:hypothetical protein